jgi:thiol-disulfide isomerase/thioredoxin
MQTSSKEIGQPAVALAVVLHPLYGGPMSRLLSAALLLALVGAAPAADEKKNDPFADMIGKPAPEVGTGFTLHGKPATLADLKGKVVLLDFWAVWCGPCVATFPHLRDWNTEYKKKGLEIVGVTTYFEGFDFDKKAGKLTRAKDKLSNTQEQDMLKGFAEHHKLQHRLVMVPRDEWGKVCKGFKVTGIPHVVLLDRKGNVRMVKVGSGEENAKALEKTIKELVAEKD